MKLIRIEASSFRGYLEAHLDFPECRHIRICGENGVGKSTIIESLGWTIFGRLRTGSSIRDATHRERPLAKEARALSHSHLSWGKRLPCVKWTVEIGDERIQISRWRGGARVVDGQDDGSPSAATGSGGVTKYMVERLGIDYDGLRATAWCLQGDVMRPVTMAKQDRRRLIRRLLLEDRESSAAARNRDAAPADVVKDARQQVEDARKDLDRVNGDLKCAEKQESEARKRLDTLQERWKTSLDKRLEHKVLRATIEGLEREEDDLRHNLKDCEGNLQAMREIKDRADDYDPAVLDREFARLEEDLSELGRLEKTLQGTRERRLIRNAGAKVQSDWYAAMSETLASAIMKGQCSTCERRIWRGHSTLTSKLDQAKAEATRFHDQRTRTNVPGTEENDLSGTIRHLAGEIVGRQDRVSNLQYERGYFESAELVLNLIPAQIAKHDKLDGRLKRVLRCLVQSRQKLDAIGYRTEEHKCLDAQVRDAKKNLRAASDKAKCLREKRERCDRRCWELAQIAVDSSAKAAGVHIDEEKVRSELANKMTDIVKTLICDGGSRPPLAVSVDDNFKPTLHEHDASGPEVSSGGLDVIVALAMRLALLNIMKDRRGSAKGFIGNTIILDEPFSNVDSRRAERFLKLLLGDGKWRVNQVLEIGSVSRLDSPENCAVYRVESLDNHAESRIVSA